jgi:hypothetical protein
MRVGVTLAPPLLSSCTVFRSDSTYVTAGLLGQKRQRLFKQNCRDEQYMTSLTVQYKRYVWPAPLRQARTVESHHRYFVVKCGDAIIGALPKKDRNLQDRILCSTPPKFWWCTRTNDITKKPRFSCIPTTKEITAFSLLSNPFILHLSFHETSDLLHSDDLQLVNSASHRLQRHSR